MIKTLTLEQDGKSYSIKRCILSPLGDKQYSFTEDSKTGDMTEWGMGIGRFNDDLKTFIGGVLIREEVIELRDFLSEWISDN